MPGSADREDKIPVRRFEGTMLAVDPAFVPPGFLTHCDNWIPDPTYVLTKRCGSLTWRSLPAAAVIDPFVYNLGSDGHRYLYAMATQGSGADTLYRSIDDGAFAAVPSGTFAHSSPRYGMVAVGDTIYVGNDNDPIKYVTLGAAAVDLVQLGLANDSGATAVFIDDPNSNLLAGTYSYRWGVYDDTNKRWVSLANVRTVTTPAASRQRLSFRAPTGGLAAGQKWHLFVAGVDQMIEGAHDQTPDGLPVSTGADQFALLDDPTVDTTVVPIPSTVTRHGSHLVAHRGCVWGAGGLGVEGERVWATSVVVPGLETTAFDQGVFFPATALTRNLGDRVTGLSVVPQSSGNMQPTSPMAIFTNVSTWLWSGDLSADDPGATLTQVSAEVGCPSDRTIVATTVGVVFCGKRSVYLLTPSSAEPKDIGWPIENAIRQIPEAFRGSCWAIFHRGFYKLAIVPPGQIYPTAQWWLDLRHGLGDPPAWWGPHTTPQYTASVRAATHPDEDDRQWAALAATGTVLLVDQAERYIEDGSPPVPIVSRMTTAYLDDGAPLTPKLAKRARVIGRVESDTSLAITVSGDEALSTSGVLPLHAAGGGTWDISDWNAADWTVSGLDLAELELPVPELRARAFQATLAHTDALRVDLRDFELRVQPSSRETR